jgi:hypothetical protein
MLAKESLCLRLVAIAKSRNNGAVLFLEFGFSVGGHAAGFRTPHSARCRTFASDRDMKITA